MNALAAASKSEHGDESFLRRAFNHCDGDGDGTISLAEFSEVLARLGHDPTDHESADIFARFDEVRLSCTPRLISPPPHMLQYVPTTFESSTI